MGQGNNKMFFDDEPVGGGTDGGSTAEPTPEDENGNSEGTGNEGGMGGDQSM